MIISKEIKEEIETIISTNLDNTTSTTDVINWLNNFESNDWNFALKVLRNLEYISINKTIKIYNEGLAEVLKVHKQKDIIFMPIGEFGKSGTSMVYFINQTPIAKDKRYKRWFYFPNSLIELNKILDDPTFPKTNFILVLVDDFLGSGKSATKYYLEDGLKATLDTYLVNPSIIILSLVYLSSAKKHIQSVIPNVSILGEQRHKAFSNESSVFGYRERMLPIREFCFKYGKLLETHSCKPLGYDNSQGLVAFAHTTPNNTLPIFWSSKDGWYPLFPRFGRDKIYKLDKFKNDIRYWLSIAGKIGMLGFEEDNLNLYKRLNFLLISIIRLKKAKRPIPIICQILNITLGEYYDTIEKGQNRGLFTQNEEITPEANKVYDEIIKKISFTKNRVNSILENDNFEEVLYVPSMFRGKT